MDININYKNKKVEKLCTDVNYATKKLGNDVARILMRRIEQIKAFKKFGDIPAGKPWKKEKIVKKRKLDLVYAFYIISC